MTPQARGAAILMYHRIREPLVDPWDLCVSPARFAEHLAMLAREFRPISLANLADALATDSVPDGAVAITFDDGYRDNLLAGLPALVHASVPATVFVVSGTLGQQDFWWDRVERIFLGGQELPDELVLVVDGQSHRWRPGRPDRVGGRWRADDPAISPRHATYRDVWELIHGLDTWTRHDVCAQLSAWALHDRDRADLQILSDGELRALSAHPLITIGGHTVSHPALSTVDAETAIREIAECKRDLERLAGAPVDLFSYPYGDAGAETDGIAERVRESGYRLACTTFQAPVRKGTDPLRVPRMAVGDWTGEELAARIRDLLRQ